MAKKKQEVKLKEPVRIRFKQLANGNQSIYLDYYTGDVIRKENYVAYRKGVNGGTMTLLYKEMRLVAHPTSIVFAFLGCLVLVPSYPYSVIFMFGCLAPYITFLNARETMMAGTQPFYR